MTKTQKNILKVIFKKSFYTKNLCSFTQMYFGVLTVFEKYFIAEKYVKYLFEIKEIYFLTGHVSQELELRHRIFDVVRYLDNTVAYLDCMYKYFCEFVVY